MRWTKSPEALVAFFDQNLPADPSVERRKMFGYPAAVVNGNMFAGLHQDSFVLRLPEADRAELMERHGGGVFEPLPGRAMREYVTLPQTLLSDRTALSACLDRSLAYVAALPRKAKKERSRRRPS